MAQDGLVTNHCLTALSNNNARRFVWFSKRPHGTILTGLKDSLFWVSCSFQPSVP